MKTLKLFVTILFIIMNYQNSFSYGVAITNPCVTRDFPTPYFYSGGTISVDFRLDTFHVTDSKFARCKIFAIQGNTQVLMYNEIVEAGINLSTPINPVNLPDFGYNEPVEIKIVATSSLFPNLPFSNSAFAILYKEGMSKKYGSIFNGVPAVINTGPATFFSSNDCRTLASGTYFTKQYLITYTLTGNFTDSIPVADSNYSLSFSGALPNFQKRWGFKISQSATEAKFIGFVYKVFNVLGQEFEFRPANLQQTNIVYHYVSKPVISGLTQYPDPLTPGNHTGIIMCDLGRGTQPLTYEWRDSNNIHNHQIINFGPSCPYVLIIANLSNYNDRVEPFSCYVRAHNEFGYSDWKKKRVLFGSDPHGCPTIATEFEGNMLKDNPVFNKSPDDPSKDIKDFYMLNDPMLENRDLINFSIIETANDESRIDKLDLIRITVDNGKEVSVTEDGEVIDYTTDLLKNTAVLNSKVDVSDLLRDNDDEILELRKDDKLEINFAPGMNDEYIVMRIRTGGIKHNDAAVINTSNGEILNIKCRSNFGNICLKVKPEDFTGFKMTALQDCYVNKIALVKNDNEHLTENLSLVDAYNESGNIIKYISDADNVYAYVSKDNAANFIFKNNRDTEKKSFYCVTLSGGYKPGTGSKGEITDDLINNYKFKLSDNLPNPFNPVTKIKFEVPESGLTKLTVYDISGKEIRSLMNEFKAAGRYDVIFDGSGLSSGVYFYKLQFNGLSLTNRMILIK
jgi:hypothetical protein